MVHIIGAGIAGMLLAEALEQRGREWRVYERAPEIGAEASGKNAGIVRTYEADPVISAFAEHSLAYYIANEPSFQKNGILLRPWEFDYGVETNESRPFSHGRFTGFFLPENGTLEPMALLNRLAAKKYQYGKIYFDSEVLPEFDNNKLCLRHSGGAKELQILDEKDQVVVTAGEGCALISERLGVELGLISHQRTLYEYHNRTGYNGPVEWDEESGCYFRPWGESLVATAGEQIPVPVTYAHGNIAIKSDDSVKLLESQFPLLGHAELTSYRTCRRTMPLDNRPFCGADAKFSNLFWFTGLGGRGVSIAPSLADTLADLVCGQNLKQDLTPFSPARIGN